MKKNSKRIITITLSLMLAFGIANTALAYKATLNPSAHSESMQNYIFSAGFSDKNTSAISTISGVNVPSYYYVQLDPGLGGGGNFYARKRNPESVI